jgi:hypothetical protein
VRRCIDNEYVFNQVSLLRVCSLRVSTAISTSRRGIY